MSRNTDPAVTSATQLTGQRFRQLMTINSLTYGSFYGCTGDRFIYTMGNTYSPIGNLGGIEKIQEDADPFPRAVRAWISIANTVAMYDALNEKLYRKNAVVHAVRFNESFTLVGTPQIQFKGRIDTARIKNESERGDYLEIEIESRLKQAPAAAYFTKEFFQARISTTTDRFLNFIHDIPFYVPTWGQEYKGTVYRDTI